MDFSGIPLFSLMKVKLDYMSQRQAVLAQNIANADTPGYKAKDIAAPDFDKLIQANGAPSSNLRMTVTNPKHLSLQPGGSAYEVTKRVGTDEQNPNGNNVTVEDEMSKVAQNQADYQKVLNLYSKAIGMFKTAIGSTSGA